jgi:hypothetical protein
MKKDWFLTSLILVCGLVAAFAIVELDSIGQQALNSAQYPDCKWMVGRCDPRLITQAWTLVTTVAIATCAIIALSLMLMQTFRRQRKHN